MIAGVFARRAARKPRRSPTRSSAASSSALRRACTAGNPSLFLATIRARISGIVSIKGVLLWYQNADPRLLTPQFTRPDYPRPHPPRVQKSLWRCREHYLVAGLLQRRLRRRRLRVYQRQVFQNRVDVPILRLPELKPVRPEVNRRSLVGQAPRQKIGRA